MNIQEIRALMYNQKVVRICHKEFDFYENIVQSNVKWMPHNPWDDKQELLRESRPAKGG